MKSNIFIPSEKHKALIAYHDHCIDGFTSAWACWRGLIETTSIYAEDINLMALSYDDITKLKDRAHKYDIIYIVDFSVTPEDLALLSSVTKVVTIDHHKKAIDMYDGINLFTLPAKLVFDCNECGASLVWKYFFPDEPLPALIHYVRDYDLWRFEHKSTTYINRYLRLQEKALSRWSRIANDFETTKIETAISMGSAMQAYHQSVVNELVDQAEECNINGSKGLYVNCSPQFSSDVGHALAIRSRTYGATFQQEPGGKVKWSLRSNKGYDVNELAKSFGGGGHANAAGFYLSVPTDDVTKLGITLWAK